MAVETRQLGVLQRLQEFCKKNNLPITTTNPRDLIFENIKDMALKNVFRKRTDSERNYIKISVRFLGEHIVTGWFTPDEIKDLNDIGSEIRLE